MVLVAFKCQITSLIPHQRKEDQTRRVGVHYGDGGELTFDHFVTRSISMV